MCRGPSERLVVSLNLYTERWSFVQDVGSGDREGEGPFRRGETRTSRQESSRHRRSFFPPGEVRSSRPSIPRTTVQGCYSSEPLGPHPSLGVQNQWSHPDVGDSVTTERVRDLCRRTLSGREEVWVSTRPLRTFLRPGKEYGGPTSSHPTRDLTQTPDTIQDVPLDLIDSSRGERGSDRSLRT